MSSFTHACKHYVTIMDPNTLRASRVTICGKPSTNFYIKRNEKKRIHTRPVGRCSEHPMKPVPEGSDWTLEEITADEFLVYDVMAK